jgi:hypothetical protein
MNYIYQMKKYVITRSMNRDERCQLIMKLYEELLTNGKFHQVLEDLEKSIKAKKKGRLYGGKKIDDLHSVITFKHKGIDVYNIITENKGIDIIFNTSPIDAPYVEYIRVASSKIPIIFTEHLLARYNERAYDNNYENFKSIIIALHAKNPVKANIAHEDSGDSIQRIKEGFLLGKSYDKYVVLNTFYNKQEAYDNDLKSRARGEKLRTDKLTKAQVTESDLLQFQHASGKISTEDFNYEMNLKGLI